MLDQASELRNLVRLATRDNALTAGPAPHLVALTGGRVRVGVTTMAVHLSMALVDQGLRVVLVDADLFRGDVAQLCNLQEHSGVGDILAARRNIHEVLQRGPAGVLVVPGVWNPEHAESLTQRAQERLLKQIHSLGRHADVVLIDIGNSVTPIVQRFWFAAHDILLVTTSDTDSVMDGYATVKSLLGQGADPEAIRLIVNRVARNSDAQDVFRRLSRSSGRFLGREIQWLGTVMNDPQMQERMETLGLPEARSADSAVAQAMQLMACRLVADITSKASVHVA